MTNILLILPPSNAKKWSEIFHIFNPFVWKLQGNGFDTVTIYLSVVTYLPLEKYSITEWVNTMLEWTETLFSIYQLEKSRVFDFLLPQSYVIGIKN